MGRRGFVVGTPECNHSYPPALKNVLDCLAFEWWGKPASFIGLGGVAGSRKRRSLS